METLANGKGNYTTRVRKMLSASLWLLILYSNIFKLQHQIGIFENYFTVFDTLKFNNSTSLEGQL